MLFLGSNRRCSHIARTHSEALREVMRASVAICLQLAVATHAFAPVASPRIGAAHRAAVRFTAPAAHMQGSGAAISGSARVAAPMMAEGLVEETTARSAVKAIGWRLTAGVVTAITSLIFTKSLAMAASIVGWDLCSKSVTMFIGERLWNKVDWGKSEGADSNQRSIAKALAWRLFAAVNTLIGAALLTKGKAGVAGKIAGTDSIVKTVLFYFYERMWAAIGWGKVPVAEQAPVVIDTEAA